MHEWGKSTSSEYKLKKNHLLGMLSLTFTKGWRDTTSPTGISIGPGIMFGVLHHLRRFLNSFFFSRRNLWDEGGTPEMQ